MKPNKKVVEQPEVHVWKEGFGLRRFTIEEELQQFKEETVKQMNDEIDRKLRVKFNKLLPKLPMDVLRDNGFYCADEPTYGIFVSETMSGYCEDVAELIQYMMLAEQNEERYMMKCPRIWADLLYASRLEYR